MTTIICPCGSGQSYSECCEPFISGKTSAPTAEALMRSRYTAYTQANVEYIARTMQPPAAHNFDPQSTRTWAEQIRWEKLEVLKCFGNAEKAYVEFRAHYWEENKKQMIHEVSEFHWMDSQWFYTNGRHIQLKIGRNDPCFCGSNKKYKKCCG